MIELQLKNQFPIQNLVVLQLFAVGFGYPITKPSDDYAYAYLERFGYIPDNQLYLRTLDSRQLQVALQKFQYFADITPTGTVDNATLSLMNLPRCGNLEKLDFDFNLNKANSTKPKPNQTQTRRKRYILDSKWEKIYLTYRVLNYPKSGSCTKEIVDQQVAMAFQIWENEANIHVVKSASTSAGNADIEISFVTGDHNDGIGFSELEVDGVGKVIAHAWKPFNRQPLRGDIHFNDDVAWTTGPGQEGFGFDFFRTMVHEAGHALGLEHSPKSNTIMYFAVHGYESNLRLSIDDRDGIQQLYGKKPGTAVVTKPRKPYIVPSGTPNKNIPWPCYILQEDDPKNFKAIKYCYQQYYKKYYLNSQLL